jgi:hypothetical protein
MIQVVFGGTPRVGTGGEMECRDWYRCQAVLNVVRVYVLKKLKNRQY